MSRPGARRHLAQLTDRGEREFSLAAAALRIAADDLEAMVARSN